MAQWWTVIANGQRLGRCFATLAEVQKAAGAWHTVDRGVVNIFCRPAGRL